MHIYTVSAHIHSLSAGQEPQPYKEMHCVLHIFVTLKFRTSSFTYVINIYREIILISPVLRLVLKLF